MFEKLFGVLLSFFVGAWLARYLGPVNYGVYAYSISLVGLFGAFTSFGIDTIVIREFVKGEFKENELFWSGLAIKIFGSSLVFILVGLGFLLTENSIETKLLVVCVSISMILKSSHIIELLFESKVLLKYPSITKFISLTTSSVLKLIFILLEFNLIYFGIIFIIEALVLTFGLVYFIQRLKKNILPLDFNYKIIKYLIKNSYPLLFSGIFVTIYMRIDQVMIKELLGEYDLGIYSVAVKLTESINFIPGVIVGSFFPAIVRATKNKSEYFNRIKKLFFFLISMAALISLITNFTSGILVEFLFGEEFLASIPLINLLIWSSLSVNIGVLMSAVLINEGLQNSIFTATLIGATSNILLNFTLIPEKGVTGAVFSTIISYALSAIIFYLFNPKTRRLLIQCFQ